jgi:hypothetical protein
MNPGSRPSPRAPALLALLGLILATLACTSNDTLFIHLTETPVPTVTPTPLAIETRFKIHDKATIVSATFQITMYRRPGPPSFAEAASAPCFPNTRVDILNVSRNVDDPKDPVIYYDVQCASATGWVPEYWLTPLNPNGSAVVKSADGKGAVLYSNPDVTSEPASPTPCADGTTLSISSLTLNPDASATAPDNHIYVQVTCGDVTGYALESDLVPAGS